MPGEIITYAGVAVPIGYVGKKLLDPTLEALGDQIKVHLSNRMAPIFELVGIKSKERSDLQALPPGFAITAIQNASVSEDDPDISEMWANLLIDASADYSNMHLIFADILSQIGGAEARLIKQIWDKRGLNADDLIGFEAAFNASHPSIALVKDDYSRSNNAMAFARQISAFAKAEFPLHVRSVQIGFDVDGAIGASLSDSRELLSCMLLERQCMLKANKWELRSENWGKNTLVCLETHEPTPLAWQFLEVCEASRPANLK